MAVTSLMGRGGKATLPLLSSFRRIVVVEGEVRPRRYHASQQLRDLSRQPVENLTKVVSPDERSLNVERKYLPSKASEASSNTAS